MLFEEINILHRFKTSGTHPCNRCDLFEKLSSLAICALYGSLYFTSNFFFIARYTSFLFFSHFDHFFCWMYNMSSTLFVSFPPHAPNLSILYILFCFCWPNKQSFDESIVLSYSKHSKISLFTCLLRDYVLWCTQDFYQTTSMKCTVYAHHIDRYVIDSHS